MMRTIVVAVAVMVGAAVAAPTVAVADGTGTDEAALVPTTTTVTVPAARAGVAVPLSVEVSADDGNPVPRGAVTVERRVGGTWRSVADALTGDDGVMKVPVELRKRNVDNVFRASYAGDTTYAASASLHVRADLVKRRSRLVLRLPDSVVDEKHARFSVEWHTRGGEPVSAARVRIQVRKERRWRTVHQVRTNAKGRAVWHHKVRNDSRWRAVGRSQSWVKGDVSNRPHIDNLPPGRPVVLPRKAPRPRIKLPDQPRATKKGAAVTIRRIPNGMWRQMKGRTWHSGCPVGRSGLRVIGVNYWAYDGYRRRGEIVVNARVAGRVGAAFKEMYDRRFPIRSMYRVDRFGWSKKVRGGNDYKSMAAGNTSAFNCRSVVNRPGVRSPHSWGTAVDVNTWENPYRSATGLVPNTWWQAHSNPRYAWRSRKHPVVRLMRRHGLLWTYGLGDTQHFDATVGTARVRIAPRCAGPCD